MIKIELKKFIGNKIKELRLSRSMNQDQLADLLETTKQTVSRYESGGRQANQDVLFQLSSVFSVSVDYFFPSDDKVVHLPSSNYDFIPAKISAGLPLEVDAITDVEKLSIPDALMGKHAGQPDIYITRINGESMNKVMQDGSLIAVKPVELHDLKENDIVVYSHNHNYGVKRFFKNNDEIWFRPHSTDFRFRDDIYNEDDLDGLQIHGKVVLYIVELD